MSIIEAIRDYIMDYDKLTANLPVWVNYIGAVPIEYNIVPIAGPVIEEEYINGASIRSFPFALQSVESTADNLHRLQTMGFFEAFSEWLDQQTVDKVLPTLSIGQTSRLIETTGWAYLYKQGFSETGIYQIQCRLQYRQVALVLTPPE